MFCRKPKKIDPIPSLFVFILIGVSLSLTVFLIHKFMQKNNSEDSQIEYVEMFEVEEE